MIFLVLSIYLLYKCIMQLILVNYRMPTYMYVGNPLGLPLSLFIFYRTFA